MATGSTGSFCRKAVFPRSQTGSRLDSGPSNDGWRLALSGPEKAFMVRDLPRRPTSWTGLKAAIDWALAQNGDANSPFFG